jgi:hypothetical protein
MHYYINPQEINTETENLGQHTTTSISAGSSNGQDTTKITFIFTSSI